MIVQSRVSKEKQSPLITVESSTTQTSTMQMRAILPQVTSSSAVVREDCPSKIGSIALYYYVYLVARLPKLCLCADFQSIERETAFADNQGLASIATHIMMMNLQRSIMKKVMKK